MGFNGEKVLVPDLLVPVFICPDYTYVVCGFKWSFFMPRVWPFIVQLLRQLKAVEKTQWERLHVSYVPSRSLRLAWTEFQHNWNSPHAPTYNGFHLFRCFHPPLGKKREVEQRDRHVCTGVPSAGDDVYHSRREQRRAVVHKAASHKTIINPLPEFFCFLCVKNYHLNPQTTYV